MRGLEQHFATGLRGSIRQVTALIVVATLSRSAGAQSWSGYGGNAQHTALVQGPSQVPAAIRWSVPVDLDPQDAGAEHYGSPAITAKNTIIFPLRTTASGDFVIRALNATTGQQIWMLTTDYVLPSHNWVPPVGITLLPGDTRVIFPGAGGTVWVRNAPNNSRGSVTRVAFFGTKYYTQNPDEFNSAILICTPISSDGSGNLTSATCRAERPCPVIPRGFPVAWHESTAMVTARSWQPALSQTTTPFKRSCTTAHQP